MASVELSLIYEKRKEAERFLEEAKKKAENIISDAKRRAEEILTNSAKIDEKGIEYEEIKKLESEINEYEKELRRRLGKFKNILEERKHELVRVIVSNILGVSRE